MTTTTTTEKTTNISDIIDTLIEQRRKWEIGTFAASNAELYALLGGSLDLYLKVRKDMGLSKAVNELLCVNGIAYKSSTSLALKIVRLIFVGAGNESKLAHRAFTYARVLTVAADEGITAENLPKFIIDNNGIDELRRKAKGAITDGQKATRNREFAEAALSVQAEFTSVDMSDALQPVDGAQYSLALVRKNDDGSGSIVFGTNNIAAINTVLSIAGKALKTSAVQEIERKVEMSDAAQRAQNMERLKKEIEPQIGVRAPSQLPHSVTFSETVPA